MTQPPAYVEMRREGLAIRRPRFWPHRARQRAFQWGCLPVALAVTGFLLLLLNLVTYRQAPVWVESARVYLISGHITVSLVVLAVMQLIATWTLGLLAAWQAGALAIHAGADVRRRLAIVCRRICIAAWAVLLLRLMLLAGLALAALFVLTDLFGPPLPSVFLDDVRGIFEAQRGLPIIVVAGLVLINLLTGPFLRLRYSLALGALAAGLARRADERPWAAINARLGAGLAGGLALVWGVAIITLAVLTVFDPSSYHPDYLPPPRLFPLLPERMANMVTVSIVSAAILAVYLAGQVVLPPVYLWLAQWRVRRMAGGR